MMNFKNSTIIIAILLYTLNVSAQKILIAKTSDISFFSKTPVKDIEAENKTSVSLINLDTKEIAVKISVKSFIFPNKLMQEHFNENYLETEKYPFSTFKGKINETIDLNTDGKYPVTATGKINLHGVERDQIFKGTATVLNKKLTIDSIFDIALVDFKIEVPKLVFQEIAEKIKVTLKINYEEKK